MSAPGGRLCLIVLSTVGTGDVEKLLKEHRENQDLVRSIGASHYQIVFPVQLRHHEKMGISTREIGATKVNSIQFQSSVIRHL